MNNWGGQHFLEPRGIKYLNTGLATANCMIPWYSFVLKPSFSRRIWTYYTLCIFRCTVSIQQVHENGKILGLRYTLRCALSMGKYGNYGYSTIFNHCTKYFTGYSCLFQWPSDLCLSVSSCSAWTDIPLLCAGPHVAQLVMPHITLKSSAVNPWACTNQGTVYALHMTPQSILFQRNISISVNWFTVSGIYLLWQSI
jgi:hypothetical protein